MSQLRAMIIMLSALDLEPDEILARLDDLAARVARERAAGGHRARDVKFAGASCLYLVYDPVAGHCIASRAGHAYLVTVSPEGIVSAPGFACHPPLGADDRPFQTTEFNLPPGSIVLLDSGGADQTRHGPAATAERLREAVSRSGPDVHKVLEGVGRLLSPARDAALLVARTRSLGAGRVASRTLPPDAAAVAVARAWTGRQLARWMLDELAFTTTLVVSELVTNAIRYSTGPVALRLIKDEHTLICEVSDTSSAAPHPRKARLSDESGRGLSIVTQLAQHQGTRFTACGKTVWTEQALPA
jgi:anti-sigma regulatory factor (Ser/Thr protein kinase)